MRSNKQLVNELKAAPAFWMDAAIVVAFETDSNSLGKTTPIQSAG
jgi:hypothetical protein